MAIDVENVDPSAEVLLLPGNPPPALVQLARPLPGFVIIVHGVNDLGETYHAQETGICAGLNTRLDRTDIKPAAYKLPPDRDDTSAAAKAELHTVRDDADLVYYRRQPEPDGWSPVIPFYWGYRAEKAEKGKHGQFVDPDGNRVDINGAKEGGPFANATSNVVDMWADGFNKMILGFLSLNWVAGKPTHPLLHAAERRYMILGAQRLAAMIQMIRDRNPHAVINIVAHSQGCLLSLVAHAILKKKNIKPVDCLVMNNPPYSLEEPFIEQISQTHGHQQTTEARVTTLKNVLEFMTKSPQATPALATILDPKKNSGFTGLRETANYADRDNRGRVFLYFCPEDLTVGLASMQGIGWQGVPDDKDGQPMLPNLGTRFHQRIWTMRERKGTTYKVGEGSRHVVLEKGETFWAFAKDHSLRSELKEGTTRTLASGVDLPAPYMHNLKHGETKGHTGFLDVGPIDAAIAVTNKGEEKTVDPTTGDTKGLSREDLDDWRPISDEAMLSYGDLKELEGKLNAGKAKDDQVEVTSAHRISGGKLHVNYKESDKAAQIRWQTQEVDLNSYHSGIVANPDHSQHVTAWDLAIGPARICAAKSKAKTYEAWVHETRNFVVYLCAVADWRMVPDDLTAARKKPALKEFFAEDAAHQELLDATALYYWKGHLPKALPKPEELPLLARQTVRDRSLGRPVAQLSS